MKYNKHYMNSMPLTNTSIPYSRLDVWVNLLVHELFHHYQYHSLESDWKQINWGGGLSMDDYPVTAKNIELSLLERHALLAGRDAAKEAEKIEVLRRVLAIRHTRTQLPEARPGTQTNSSTSKTYGRGSTAPKGVGQHSRQVQVGRFRQS